jgi:outer membrane immunogenic protein
MKLRYLFVLIFICSSSLVTARINKQQEPVKTSYSNNSTETETLQWEGFNFGINLGVNINHTKGTITPDGALGPAPGRSDSWSYDNVGFTGGGQLGYKYQIDYFVFGIETDFNYSDLKKSYFAARTVPSDPGGGSNISNDVSHHFNWFGTLRPILGLGFDSFLIYATGGLSYGYLKSATEIIYRADPYRGSQSKTKAGWTAGGGLAYRFLQSWSLKLEYLFMDLGNLRYRVSDTTGTNPTYYFYTKLENRFSSVRLGVDFMF